MTDSSNHLPEQAPLNIGVGRRGFLAAAGAATAGALIGTNTEGAEAAPQGSRTHALYFGDAHFRASHNSYSGNLEGQKGPILQQLDKGIRFIEMDIWGTNYAIVGDYQLGHDAPDDAEVDHAGGNPTSALLRDWVSQVASWSAAHPAAAPIVLMLDMKTNLVTTPRNYAAGNLMALNDEIADVLGKQIFPGYRAPNGPQDLTVDSLRGKILPLLSGDVSTRVGYFRQTADHPSVAINAHGQVVEIHDDATGRLWYWTGQYQADGSVTWLRYGSLDTGATPAVALNDDGTVVEMHSRNASTVWYRVGNLGSDGEISWGPAVQFDSGVLPTVSFTGTNAIREIHRSQSNDQNWVWNGTLDPVARTIALDSSTHAAVPDPLQPKTTASSGHRSIHVDASWQSTIDPMTLTYSTGSVRNGLIRPTQVFFNENQVNNSQALADHAPFWGATATNSAWIIAARKAGKIVRGWDFDDASYATDPLANYAATNYPYSDWYQALMKQANAVS